MNRCITTYKQPTGEVCTFIVYHATVQDFLACRPLGFYDPDRGMLTSVKEASNEFQEKGERRNNRPWWDRHGPPQRYYFNKHLSRERVQGDPSEDTAGQRQRTAGEIYDEQMGEGTGAQDERSPDTDGDVKC